MSLIMDAAKMLDNQLQALEDKSAFLESELFREKEKNKKTVCLITDFLYELQEVLNDE